MSSCPAIPTIAIGLVCPVWQSSDVRILGICMALSEFSVFPMNYLEVVLMTILWVNKHYYFQIAAEAKKECRALGLQ